MGDLGGVVRSGAGEFGDQILVAPLWPEGIIMNAWISRPCASVSSSFLSREMPCSYDAYCRERSQKVTDDTLESYRIMDSSEKLLKRFREGDKQITVEYREEKQDGRMI